MRNKKGFTLIELLAVIVILAIIALIATPIILGIIEDARKGSIEASANGYIDAVEYKIARNEIKGETISDGTYDVTKLEVDLDGEKPDYGEVTIEKGKISRASLCIDGKTVELKDNKPQVTGACASLYKDSILNGADPVLKGELVPVNIGSNGTVTKADVTKEWYNYENKNWANAVILFDNQAYKVGEEIKEENIKEYYVWIPRYAYRLWNVNSNNLDNVEKPIEIVFGNKAKTTGENNGDMYLHPAFTNFDTQGIWIGKFEPSYNEETFIDSSKFLSVNPNTESATNSDNIIIKPNVRGLSNKLVSDYFTLLYNAHRNLNSHMMTNMEWGAAAYLTYSVYGRCDDDSCTEVTINSVHTGYYPESKQFEGQWEYGTTITGCAANSVSGAPIPNQKVCQNAYNTEKGVLASTTGNITGIYDMSGGNFEYAMGVLKQPDGTIFSGRNSTQNSGFKGLYGCPTCDNNTSGITENIDGLDMPDKRYYNAYTNFSTIGIDSVYNYNEGMLGDATKEVANTKTDGTSGDRGLWFNDHSHFVGTIYPWIGRGGHWCNYDGAGIFYFVRLSGTNVRYFSTRTILAF